MQEPNEFTGTEISVEKKIVTFADLPDLPKPIWAIVTDANGEQVTQKRISAASNVMDLRGLHKGDLYYLTIMYKDKSRKAFVLHL